MSSSPSVNGNLGLLTDLSDYLFCNTALENLGRPPDFIWSSDPSFLSHQPGQRLSPDALPLDRAALEEASLFSTASELLSSAPKAPVVLIDMRWSLDAPYVFEALQNWGGLAERLVATFDATIVSIYDQELMVEDTMRGALSAHPQFLAPTGIYPNPHWVPATIRNQSDPEARMRYLMEQMVPDYRETPLLKSPAASDGVGTMPNWATRPNRGDIVSASASRWHIHCLGPLKVLTDKKNVVNWAVTGGSAQKTKALFAYLMTQGDAGADTEQLCELLWGDATSDKDRRNRLHHTVSVLRRVLGSQKAVTRSGDRYHLRIPKGSWIDVEQFEQLCRRGVSLYRHDNSDNALRVYQAVERIYAGDLFQDVARKYVENEYEDWCLPKRQWLRDMAAKLHTDMSRLLRGEARLREAQHHCARALDIEPADENGNVEMIRVLQAQGRNDAVARHYRQFSRVARDLGIAVEQTKVHKVASTIIVI